MSWTSLCQTDELTEGQGKFVQIGGYALAVFMDAGKFYVLDNNCPHAGGPLADGFVEDGCCVCPWHAWAFKLDSGQLRDAPGIEITTYKTRLLERAGHATLVQADLPMP
jgi:nitrite reductase (NADH) small subunit/3-phenylpropionate/trans-cinnamate dioxygenase ferredoxin subunit